jgi:putative transcriptional regulator
MSELGRELIEGMEGALAYAQGRSAGETRTTVVEVPVIDVRALRERLDLSQRAFARAFGFSLSTVRNWEQGVRRPEKAARILLALIERDPQMVRDTISEIERTATLNPPPPRPGPGAG